MYYRWRYWGRGMHLLPLQRHTRETSLSTWLPITVLDYNISSTNLIYFHHVKLLDIVYKISFDYFERWQYPPKQEKKSNKQGSGNAYFLSSEHLFTVTKTQVSNTMRDGSTYQNMKKKKRHHYTWVRKCILSATSTLVHRRQTWHPSMTLVIGGAQRDFRPWQCIPLPIGIDCAHTVFVFPMFALSVTEVESQPNIVSHYG